MSAITPQTELRLVKCPIESDNRNQLTFSSATNQYNYFNSLPHLEVDNFTYQRKDSVIRYPAHIDSILTYNYVMYKNENYSNKWFYAFITKMEYVNDNMTLITIKTDVYQTWMFDMVWKKSFVEREHVNDDTAGLHTIPEGLETGEFICNSHTLDDTFTDVSNLVYVISSAINLWIISASTDKYVPATPTKYNGIVSGTQYFKFSSVSDLEDKLKDVAARGQIESINGLFMAPSSLTTLRPTSTTEIAESTSPASYTKSISKQTTINGYTPVNKKLLTGDYNYLLVSNNNGNSVIFRYEDFSQSNCTFKVDMCLTAGCSIRMIPTNYKNVTNGDEYGINLGKLPICSYPCDMYTNWLTQNSINVMGIQISSDDINMATSLVSLVNPYTASAGISGIADSLIARKQHELIPPQSRGNLNAGDVVTASGKNTFHFYKMSVREEYAKAIDGYFSMYGYKVNSLKVPNITGRTNWNYVKTIGANIEGDIPEDHLNEIKSIFNNGITLWHNSSTYLDYSQSNAIVS